VSNRGKRGGGNPIAGTKEIHVDPRLKPNLHLHLPEKKGERELSIALKKKRIHPLRPNTIRERGEYTTAPARGKGENLKKRDKTYEEGLFIGGDKTRERKGRKKVRFLRRARGSLLRQVKRKPGSEGKTQMRHKKKKKRGLDAPEGKGDVFPIVRGAPADKGKCVIFPLWKKGDEALCTTESWRTGKEGKGGSLRAPGKEKGIRYPI